jgi:hypothetical protein
VTLREKNIVKRKNKLMNKLKKGLLFGSIASISLLFSLPAAWAQDASIDCTTAREDIAELRGEKQKVESHKSKGLFSITPIGMVVGAMSEDDKGSDGKDMHVDEYNKKIDEHIEKIRAACPDEAS